MKTMSKWVVASLVLGVTVGGSELGAQAQQPQLTAVPPTIAPSGQVNCAGVAAFRIEVERPRDLKLTSSKLVGASSWTTGLALTGRISTVDGRARSCSASGPSSASITAEEPDARTALQTCALMGATLQSGQKLVIDYRGFEAARVGAGGTIMMTKPHVVTCGVE